MSTEQVSAAPDRPSRREEGQIIVMFAAGSVLLLMLLALAVDGGYYFFQKRDAQNVSDLAALAGAQVIGQSQLDIGRRGSTALRDTDVVAAVDRVAKANAAGCAQGQPTTSPVPCLYAATYIDKARQPISGYGAGGNIPSAARGVQVTTWKSWRAFFAGVAGRPDWTADARAKAMAVQRIYAAAASQLLPIALWQDFIFDPNGLLVITEDTQAAPGPGNFGWIDWNNVNNNSAADLTASVCSPSNPPHALPWVVDGDTGKANTSGTRGCLDGYISNGSIVLVPIYSIAGCVSQGNTNGACGGQAFTYTLTGYAAVRLVSYDRQGITWLKAQLIDFINPAGVLPAGSEISDAPNQTPIYYGLVE